MRVVALIPARYQSSRFPGKMLADLNGKPLLYHTYQNTRRVESIDDVILAIDDARIEAMCIEEGLAYRMTGAHHTSGTSRIAEVADAIDADVVVNVQGDEPLVNEEILCPLIALFDDPTVCIATVVTEEDDEATLDCENVVKVVRDVKGNALYFSRARIPHVRSDVAFRPTYYRHIGVYAYRRETLLAIAALPPSAYDEAEMLEQLRWLHAGYAIRTTVTTHVPLGVDTEEDLAKARAVLATQEG